MWAALCDDSSACGNTGMGGIWQANILSFVPLTHPLPMHHLQSWAAVTSWVFPREGWDKHETSLQPYQRVWNKSWNTLLWVRSRRKLQPRSEFWVSASPWVGDTLNQQETAISSMKTNALSSHLLWTNLIFLTGGHEGVNGHTSSFSLRSFMQDPISFWSPFHCLWYTSGVTLSEVKVFIKQNVTLYSWK